MPGSWLDEKWQQGVCSTWLRMGSDLWAPYMEIRRAWDASKRNGSSTLPGTGRQSLSPTWGRKMSRSSGSLQGQPSRRSAAARNGDVFFSCKGLNLQQDLGVMSGVQISNQPQCGYLLIYIYIYAHTRIWRQYWYSTTNDHWFAMKLKLVFVLSWAPSFKSR